MSPTKMKAIVAIDDQAGKVELRSGVAVPKVGPAQILVKTTVVGLNPTDWKHAKLISPKNAIMGCDAVGVVCEMGDKVPADKIHIGQRRAFFIKGGTTLENGAFAEYSLTDWDLSFAVPQNVTDEQAATLPIPFFTAAQCLYHRLALPEPGQDTSAVKGKWLLVWSGASSVGQYAIQLAKLSGINVVAAASENRWEFLKTLGADKTVDYKDVNVVQKIKDATNDSVEYAVDCFAEHGSTKKIHDAFSSVKGGKDVRILAESPDGIDRADVEIIDTILYNGLGISVQFGEKYYKAQPEDRTFHARWLAKTPEFFEQYKIQFLNTENIGGLSAIPQSLRDMEDGKIAFTKLVATVQ